MTFVTRFSGLSRRGRWLLASLLMTGIVAGTFLYKGYTYVEHDARFCQSCHIMEEPYQKWSTSPHHLVNCHQCHKQSLKEDLQQAWFYLTQRPDKVVHHPTLDHKVCAQCHLSNDPQWKLVGETAGHKVHFEKAGIECVDCHLGGVHEFLRPVDACLKCHSEKGGKDGDKMAFVHCTDCHTFLAKKTDLMPLRDTCLGCHSKIQVGRESFPRDAPMASFDCGICHKPHGEIRPDREVCLACHEDVKGNHHGMEEGQGCARCHRPHTWRTSRSIQ